MNKKLIGIFFSCIIINAFLNLNLEAALGPFKKLFEVDNFSQSKTFAEQLEIEISNLKKRKSEQEELLLRYKAESEKAHQKLEQLKLKAKEATGTTEIFINKYLLVFGQIIQTFTEIIQNHQQTIDLLDQNVKTLQEFKEDPDFKNKNLKIPLKSIYGFEDLQKVNYQILEYENKISNFEEKIKKSLEDLENRKKTLTLAKQEYDEKKKEQQEFKRKNIEEELVSDKFTIKQKAELLDLEELFARLKHELAELKTQEITQKIHLMETQLRIAKLQEMILEKEYDRIKTELRVDEKDIKKSEQELKEQIELTNKRQDEYKKAIDTIEAIKNSKLNQVAHYKEQYCLSDSQVALFEDWNSQPVNINSWKELITTGKLINHMKFELDVKSDELKAQIENDKAKVFDKEVNNLITNSWFKLATGRLGTAIQDEIVKEIKQYEKAKVDAQAVISALNEKKINAEHMLNNNANIAENLKARIKEFREQKETIFKNNLNDFNNISIHLRDEALESIRRAESITTLIELYNSIINSRKLIIQKVDAMIDELKARLKWLGIPPLWKGVQNFIPDIKKFFNYVIRKDIKVSVKNNRYYINELIKYYKKHPSMLFSLLLQILVGFLLLVLIKLYLPDIINFARRRRPLYGIYSSLSNFIIFSLSFLNDYYIYFVIWVLCYLAIKYKIIIDSYLAIIFFLISIPFWIYLAYRYIFFLEKANAENNFSMVSQNYQKRFTRILSLILISTITILFFREAFMIAKIPKSDVPNMLLAINIIIIQFCLVFLLSKEQLLRLIPKTTELGNWLYEQVDKFYHFFLIALITIIILSNPYVGYGRHFFYTISRILLIGLLFPLFVFLHNKLKQLFHTLFFSSSDGDKERFYNARTYFGFLIILTSLCFIVFGFILAANIWGYPIGFDQIYQWITNTLYEFQSDTGQMVKVTIVDFGRIILYVIAAIIFSYLINKFILGNIFDLLLVNVGVQNAIQTLVRYLIIISVAILGLRSIGYTSLVWTLFALIAGLGVAGKEIITDFIGYFIILIQRPLKIGDFIKIDDDVTGVVRNITLRSVILRRKNSVTVIVPNSQIMTRPVVNWNYSRSYFAFEDILLTIPYTADPAKARELMLSTLDNNLNILKNPAPIVWLFNFTDNGFQFLIRGYISFDKVLEQWHISSDVRLELVRILRVNNIDVASPTRILKVTTKNGKIPEIPDNLP